MGLYLDRCFECPLKILSYWNGFYIFLIIVSQNKKEFHIINEITFK